MITVALEPANQVGVTLNPVGASSKSSINLESDPSDSLALELAVHFVGPKGTPGADGDNTRLAAQEIVGAYRAVTGDGLHCDQTLDELSNYAGVTAAAAGIGEDVVVIRNGIMEIFGGTFTPDAPIYVGPNGTLTQTAPTAPLKRIGWALSSTTINLEPYPVIEG